MHLQRWLIADQCSQPHGAVVSGTEGHGSLALGVHILYPCATLDPKMFMRIHRSAIVRLELVDLFLKGEGGDYEVQLKNGARLRVSRSRREALEQRLGVGG
jgi:hypothetical protein